MRSGLSSRGTFIIRLPGLVSSVVAPLCADIYYISLFSRLAPRAAEGARSTALLAAPAREGCLARRGHRCSCARCALCGAHCGSRTKWTRRVPHPVLIGQRPVRVSATLAHTVMRRCGKALLDVLRSTHLARTRLVGRGYATALTRPQSRQAARRPRATLRGPARPPRPRSPLRAPHAVG